MSLGVPAQLSEKKIMSNSIPITSIENAINIWRNVEGANLCLGANARCLADVYGLMIYKGETVIEVGSLSDKQQKAFFDSVNIAESKK